MDENETAETWMPLRWRTRAIRRTAYLLLMLMPARSIYAAPAQTIPVAQLYLYTIKDQPAFQEGYRRHLEWHANQHDQLAWYAWTIASGSRKGTFVDGTFGATFSALDARPDLKGDGADFVRNAASYVTAIDIETWTLWSLPTAGQAR